MLHGTTLHLCQYLVAHVPATLAGTYSVLRNDTTSPCTACPQGLSTTDTGAVSLTDCNICAQGYGSSNASDKACSQQCGGATSTYGGGQAAGSSCVTCPEMVTGFSFDVLGVGQTYAPAVVTRPRANSPADCVSAFTQVVDSAWYMGGNATLTPVYSASTFNACVADCAQDVQCLYLTFDYNTQTCSKLTLSYGT